MKRRTFLGRIGAAAGVLVAGAKAIAAKPRVCATCNGKKYRAIGIERDESGWVQFFEPCPDCQTEVTGRFWVSGPKHTVNIRFDDTGPRVAEKLNAQLGFPSY